MDKKHIGGLNEKENIANGCAGVPALCNATSAIWRQNFKAKPRRRRKHFVLRLNISRRKQTMHLALCLILQSFVLHHQDEISSILWTHLQDDISSVALEHFLLEETEQLVVEGEQPAREKPGGESS